MKTFTKTIIGYRYSELSEKAKEKAKEEYIEHDRAPGDFSMMLIEYLKGTYNLQNLDTYYSLSYSQGDGLCLYGEISYSEIFHNEMFRKIALKGLRGGQITSVKENLFKVNFKHSGRYYYANSTNIESEENSYNITDKQYSLLEIVASNITDWYLSFCKEWEDIGYDFFYKVSDEEMEENSDANDYYYEEDGILLDISNLKETA